MIFHLILLKTKDHSSIKQVFIFVNIICVITGVIKLPNNKEFWYSETFEFNASNRIIKI